MILLLNGFARVLFDHLIRAREHVGRDRQADLLRGFEIDDELELHRLFERYVSGFGAFKDLV